MITENSSKLVINLPFIKLANISMKFYTNVNLEIKKKLLLLLQSKYNPIRVAYPVAMSYQVNLDVLNLLTVSHCILINKLYIKSKCIEVPEG